MSEDSGNGVFVVNSGLRELAQQATANFQGRCWKAPQARTQGPRGSVGQEQNDPAIVHRLKLVDPLETAVK